MSPKPAINLTREELHARLWKTPRPAVASALGLSSNGLAKICDRLLIPYPAWGYWAKQRAGKALEVAPLGPAPEGAPQTISINPHTGAGARFKSRRPRSRLSREARAAQMLDIAAAMIVRDGWTNLTLRDLAKNAGISETLVYAYWSDRAALGAAMARRELQIVAERSYADNTRPYESYSARGEVVTLTSLTLAAERGGVLQHVLADPAVRQMVRREYREIRKDLTQTYAQEAAEFFDIPLEMAMVHTQLNFAVALRVGKYLAAGQLPLDEGLRLTFAISMGSMCARAGGYRSIRRDED